MKPELGVRKILCELGYQRRYRLHAKNLPGKPDIVFPKYKKAILVHGCFWHMHSDKNCKIARMPKSKKDYWNNKLLKNVKRDKKNTRAIKKIGWEVLVIWECEPHARNKIQSFLNKNS